MAIAYQTSATAASPTCSKPTGTSSGDVLVAALWSQGGTGASLTGWTAGPTTNVSATYYFNMLYRVADGSEGASFTFTSAGSIVATSIVRISGAATVSPIDGTSTAASGISATAVPAAITATGTNGLLVMGGAALSSGGTVTNIGFSAGTERSAQDAAANTIRLEMATQDIPSSGSTGTRTITATATGTAITFGAMLLLKAGSSDQIATVPSPAASTWAMPTPTAAANAVTPASASTWAMPTPVARANAVTPAAASTWAMPTPTVAVTATAVAATMTWAMGIPTTVMTVGATIPDPMASTWAMDAPSSVVIASPPAMTTSWAMGIPTTQIEVSVAIPDPATMTWQMETPEIGYGVVVVPAEMTWEMVSPSAEWRGLAPAASAAWSMGTPTIAITAEVPSMEMTWGMTVNRAGQTWPGSSVNGARADAGSSRGIIGTAHNQERPARAKVTSSRSIRGDVHDE